MKKIKVINPYKLPKENIHADKNYLKIVKGIKESNPEFIWTERAYAGIYIFGVLSFLGGYVLAVDYHSPIPIIMGAVIGFASWFYAGPALVRLGNYIEKMALEAYFEDYEKGNFEDEEEDEEDDEELEGIK